MNMFLYDYLFTVWEDFSFVFLFVFGIVILQNHARLLFFSNKSGAIIDFWSLQSFYFSVLFNVLFFFFFFLASFLSLVW